MVIGVDIDPGSARCARRNGVQVVVGDLGHAFGRGAFDIVTAVAPYVPSDDLRLLPADVQRYEPRLALDGGDDGLDVVRRIVASAARLLHRGGWLLLELGADQDRALADVLARSGFDATEAWYDEDGDLQRTGGSRLGPTSTGVTSASAGAATCCAVNVAA